MSKERNIISDVVKGVSHFAMDTLQNKYYPSINDLIGTLVGIPISGFSHFTYISDAFRSRLLSFNAGDYYNSYASAIDSMENYGHNVTRVQTFDENGYLQGTNIQWNENNSSEIGQDDSMTASFDCPDSILNKTKLLFNQKKIDTIISRFHTEGNVDTQDRGKSGLVNGNASTRYGMSHGRNLLTKRAEDSKGNGNFNTNGYNNPYCRVWTHHHQYDNISKLIRPFTDENGTPTSIGDLQRNWTFIRGNKGASKLNDNTVLNKNGFVNITPSYEPNEELKVHTKQCMFSIENLAWKGYSPYEFEKSLSWEQRGPMGGRIMWFPPYDISFTETTSVNWNSDAFIGRGEKVYTYIDTERTGTLHFKLLVDHPSIINYYEGKTTYEENGETKTYQLGDELRANMSRTPPKDTDLLRFFAGCDTIEGSAKNLTDEYVKLDDVKPVVDPVEDDIDVSTNEEIFIEEEPETEENFVFYVYYPNNYSGVDDTPGNTVEAMAYLLNGIVCQKEQDGTTNGFLQFSDLRNRLVDNGIGNGYEMSKEYGVSHGWLANPKYGSMKGKYMDWKYRVDNRTINEKLIRKANEIDQDVSENHSKNGLNIDKSLGYEDATFTFAEVAYALSGIELIRNKAITAGGGFDDNVAKIKEILEKYDIIKVVAEGLANTHGNNASETVNQQRNTLLAKNRAQSVISWLSSIDKFKDVTDMSAETIHVEQVTTKNVSDIDAKKKRAAKVTVTYKISNTKTLSETSQEVNIQSKENNISNFQEDKIMVYDKDELWEYGIYDDGNFDHPVTYWQRNPSTGGWRPSNRSNNIGEVETTASQKTTKRERRTDFNNIRYDQEYHFFKVLKEKAPMVWEKLTDKIKYFTPAFHSMTPEGFNARLTFLQQCCRQGNTVGASDTNQTTATNLAFGRPPICVLRLGDFYNTRILINNISYDYDPLQWDLNSEGIGVQPLIADVNISFTFIGGSDLAGPIARLQNAMTFNYFANTGVYDNRADSVTYGENGKVEEYDAYITPLSPNDNTIK